MKSSRYDGGDCIRVACSWLLSDLLLLRSDDTQIENSSIRHRYLTSSIRDIIQSKYAKLASTGEIGVCFLRSGRTNGEMGRPSSASTHSELVVPRPI